MQIDACALDVIFTTRFAELDMSLGFMLTSEVYNWTTKREKASLNRMEDFLWLSVWPEKRKYQQLRFFTTRSANLLTCIPLPQSFMLVRATGV